MESLGQLKDILDSVIEAKVVPDSSLMHTEMVGLAKEVVEFKNIFVLASGMIQDEIQDFNYYAQVYEGALRALEMKTRNIVLQLEDVIDSYLELMAEGKGIITCTTRTRINAHFEQLKTIRQDQLKLLLQDTKKKIGFPISPYDHSPTTTHISQNVEEPPRPERVVGLEPVTETIVEFLLQEEHEGTGVYSIVGMPGVGKTTLASNVYHDRRIQNEFSIIAWASSLEDMIVTLWEKLFKQEMPLKPLEEVTKRIQQALGMQKVLIFLEDVATWENIKKALPMDHKFCKVLLTTRNLNVASEANPEGRVIKLQCMDGNTGWELLHLIVYGKLDDDSRPEVERFGKFIVKQCGGLPQAITMVGKILVEKVLPVRRNTKAAIRIWEEIAGNVKDYLFDPDIPENMEAFMSKYYNELPYKARDCLLYSSMLPNDKSLQKLNQLLFAECLDDEDASRWHLLVSMNLLMLNQRSSAKFTFSLHCLVREFCKRKVASTERDMSLLQEIKRSADGAFEPPIQEVEKCSGFCVNSDLQEFLSEKPKLQNIRSFLCFSNEPIILSQNKYIHSKTHNFDKLRIHEAKAIKFQDFPAKLTNLLHLRYITLSGDKINVLPRSISKWHNIQTIKVNTLSPTLKIKANIWEMMQLRVLKTKAGIILTKDVKGKGCEKLENLGYLSAESCSDQVAKKAKNLKILRVRGQLVKLEGSKFLEDLVMLENLKLVNEVKAEKGLPTSQSIRFPLQLENLSTTFLDWERISSITNLASLMVLQLKDIEFVGDCWYTGSNSFPSLEFLIIDGTNLKYWTTTGDSFPELKTLILVNCKKLEEVPLELGNNKLECIEMKNVSAAAVSSAKEMDNAMRQMPTRHPLKLILGNGDNMSKNRQLFYLDEPYSFSNTTRRKRRASSVNKTRTTDPRLGW